MSKELREQFIKEMDMSPTFNPKEYVKFIESKLKEADKAIYFISQLGIEGAKRQTLEEIGNSDTDTERDFYYNVLDKIKENELKKQSDQSKGIT